DILEREDLFAAGELEFKWQDDREVDPVKQEAVLSGYVKQGIYTINEARERLGLEPLPDAAARMAMVQAGQGYVPIGANAGREGINQADGAVEAAGVEKRYDPNQPRVPKGNPNGGRRASEDQGVFSDPLSTISLGPPTRTFELLPT